MTKFTPEDLVQYVYNETSLEKSTAIKAALETDWDLQESFELILNAQKNLNEIKFSPRDESVNKILEYASRKESHLHSH